MIPDLNRIIRTARTLDSIQLLWRLRYMCQRTLPFLESELPATMPRDMQLNPTILSNFPGIKDPAFQVCYGFEPGQDFHLSILNHPFEINVDNMDWRLGPGETHRLETVTLHYHGWLIPLIDLAGKDALQAGIFLETVMLDWITQCGEPTRLTRPLAWNAYAIATRLINWIKLFNLLPDTGNTRDRVLLSMVQQADYLCSHVEWDLSGNHLIRDALGLAAMCRFLGMPTQSAWMLTAEGIIEEELDKQVPPDGMHYERSPMYHLIVMHDILLLSTLIDHRGLRTRLEVRWRQMAETSRRLEYDDGSFPLLNDAARNGCGQGHEYRQAGYNLLRDSRECPTSHDSGFVLDQAGIAGFRTSPWQGFLDVGSVGPKDQPGHAHASTLSWECRFYGRPLFMDRGTFHYDESPERQADRATASHNTLTIDGQDSSEVWKIFRVGRRAKATILHHDFQENCFVLQAEHDGYCHLSGAPLHQRTWKIEKDGPITITDQVKGTSTHFLEGHLLVNAEWEIEQLTDGWMATRQSRTLKITLEGPDGILLLTEPVCIHPEFGVTSEATSLTWTWQGLIPFTLTTTITEQKE